MTSESLFESLGRVWAEIAKFKVPAAVVGGLAMALWKYARSTRDIDILVLADERTLSVIMKELSKSGIHAQGRRPIDLGDTELFQLAVDDSVSTGFKIDLLRAKSPFARLALERRVTVSSETMGFEVQTLRCEDLILLKLAAGRIIDRADAAALIRENANTLDQTLMAHTADSLGLSKALAEILAEAGG